MGVDVASSVPEGIPVMSDKPMLPDGGHGLDAEEQSRGKVVHASDTLGMIINPEKKLKRWKLMSNPVFVKLFCSIRPRSSIREGGEIVASLEGNLHKHHYH